MRAWAAQEAVKRWGRMIARGDDVSMGHDGYLKLWALGRPKLAAEYILPGAAPSSRTAERRPAARQAPPPAARPRPAPTVKPQAQRPVEPRAAAPVAARLKERISIWKRLFGI